MPRFLLIVLSLGFILPTFAELEILGKSTIDFEKDVKPILLENCMDCHAAESPQGGLVLNSFESIVTGGEKSGPSIILGNGKKSPLIQYLRGELLPRMPAGGDPLPEKQITLISQWIDGLENTKKAPVGTIASVHEFKTTIKPLLEQNCFSCHNSDSHKSGLVLETQELVAQGGALQGPAIIPGKSHESPLIHRLRGTKAPQMPLNGNPLSEKQIDLIAKWIDTLDPKAFAQNEASNKPNWPWKPVQEPKIPVVKNKDWIQNPIDAFILAKLEQKKLKPSKPVSGHGLLRRLYFGLIGLPPSPEEMAKFLANPTAASYKQEMEKLLSDSRYGEHWGRHWLDLARYADTNGGAIDDPQKHIWRYRDYVIRAFNQDRPYDRFIKEQLAGDTISAYGSEGKIGSGFLGLWTRTEGDNGGRRFMADVVNTTSSLFMGLTLGCANCHDHKYDPLPHKDYFRIEAFFSPVRYEVQDLPFHQYEMPLQQPERWKTRKEAWKKHLARVKKEASEYRKKIKDREISYQFLTSPQDLKDWSDPGQKKLLIPSDTLRNKEEEKTLKQYTLMTGRFANPNVQGYYDAKAGVLRDSGHQRKIATYVLAGGNYKLRGEEVQPGFLSAIEGNSEPVNLDGITGSRRKVLAKWIASKKHPFTARVMVNRIWQYHFGRGLVKTPSDFGSNGSGTVHKDLIDWLAWQFMESGWSIKEVHRLILTSNVYRLSMKHSQSEPYEKIDPNNEYLWVRDPFRISAESLRDSLLAISGQLNLDMGGPAFFPESNFEQMARAGVWWLKSPGNEANRRTVYMIQSRSYPIPMIKVFDGPNLDESCVVRGNTTVTPQVFSLLNGKFPNDQSNAMAQRIINEVGHDIEKQIERAFQLAFQRTPSLFEKKKCLAFMQNATTHTNTDTLTLKQIAFSEESTTKATNHLNNLNDLTNLCLILINMNEFIFLE
ncbi:MAG: PSD1 and planctomycete cytochrome C domain-containing protein [Acidobacteriia bacterium]|nr:PSD1 and planctomycete cytochrome C domain-containing protein [Terriglobia bacterium]